MWSREANNFSIWLHRVLGLVHCVRQRFASGIMEVTNGLGWKTKRKATKLLAKVVEKSVRAPQWYDLSGYKATDTQLHTLFDVSEAAYSNVVYVKIILSLKIFIAYY